MKQIGFLSKLLLLGLVFLQTSCQTNHCQLDPTISCPLQTEQFLSLPSVFPCLSEKERGQRWAEELLLGDAFAHEWDLYRAITCYKRAKVLLHAENFDRSLQLDYNIILCYYLGNKYQDALNLFESSNLSQTDPHFPGFQNLLLMVYDCYLLTNQEDKAACVMTAINTYSPETSEDLQLYSVLKAGNTDEVRATISNHRDAGLLHNEWIIYDISAKSPQKARMLNALLPGAGYYYVGQKRSAITSFLINTLFTAAAYQFFQHGYPAAGAITTSLELGWYLGGINGAGIEAAEYNTRLYETVSTQILTHNKSFPVLMFETSF